MTMASSFRSTSSRSVIASFVLLVLAALVFAILPFSNHHSIDPQSRPAAELPTHEPTATYSTFGGSVATPRPDLRSQPLPQAKAGDPGWPAFAPRSGGLYAPADGR
ncbi:hypothetical protein [Allorhizobium taibaishanense]|uniref:Uncharacterized protein n=1 Tax=Allorhizobium taibaishanense TaxID=887144 RepID=A0A1Q9A3A4_9HYPH|nr:hypothetical protein [Allorhizobium taibaishanense]MBB4005987.1 hypothetical protein [Allorhizobium taibaishanense]OLP49012.1 hypothetical protein BJF91_18015 [Allorhizobium taibaishanense]